MRQRVKDYARAYIESAVEAPQKEAAARAEALMALLNRRGELGLFPKVVSEAEKIFEGLQRKKIIFTTAKPLERAQVQNIVADLGLNFDEVSVTEIVDPEVGAGLRLQVGDWVVDATERNRLNRLRRALS